MRLCISGLGLNGFLLRIRAVVTRQFLRIRYFENKFENHNFFTPPDGTVRRPQIKYENVDFPKKVETPTENSPHSLRITMLNVDNLLLLFILCLDNYTWARAKGTFDCESLYVSKIHNIRGQCICIMLTKYNS